VLVVIPAAGLGKRFSSAGLAGPKELLPLGSKPVLGHALAEAARARFDGAIVVVSPAKHQILDYLDAVPPPLPVRTVVQAEPRGIGDAVRRCWTGDPLGVLLPDDVVLETSQWTDLLEMHQRHNAAALCVRPVAHNTIDRFGIADCVGDRVTALVEKPKVGSTRSNLAILGRYLVTEDVIRALDEPNSDGELELTMGFAGAAAGRTGVYAVRFEGRIYDCGTPSEYANAVAAFSTEQP
jgi:UTP--glucose-1-phosphate uridylyltransferase